MQTEFGQMQVYYTARGLPRFQLELRHGELRRYQVIRGDDQYVVQQKAAALAAQWNEAWSRVTQKLDREAQIQDNQAEAERRTAEAVAELKRLETVLAQTLEVNDAVDWDSLKDFSPFPEPKPKAPDPPRLPVPPTVSREPRATDPVFVPRIGILDKLFPKRAVTKRAEAKALFQEAHAGWLRRRTTAENEHQAALANHHKSLAQLQGEFANRTSEWETTAAEHASRQRAKNATIDEKKQRYLGKEPDAVSDYCDMVLGNSRYPDSFPRTWTLDYVADSKLVVVDYQMPAPNDLPTLASVRYVKSRDEFEEKHLAEAEKNRIYDGLLYQVALRTIHELFEADVAGALAIVAFNGIVESVDPSSGHQTRACVLSVQANRDEFLAINLAAVDPKTCFKKLRGIGSSKLHSLTPVAPLVQFDKADPRFVAGYAVADGLEQGQNLAAMDWEDFEHLIRELFEREFAKSGGEVKVTRASRDGGIDAVVFDPDPIRGGKIVIQAKRYTNTVGVSAVRDLYGAVINEGANKGILVTTADYGPDSYDFAKGKPLQLLSGSHLLHLLQQHGVKARIDLHEARQLLGK